MKEMYISQTQFSTIFTTSTIQEENTLESEAKEHSR